MKTLSIITVTYRDLEGLKRTFASLRSIPKEFPWEWVVWDSSPELTAPLLPDLTTLPLVYGGAPPRGVYSAMNEAVEKAQGKYLWFLNGGDELADFSSLKEALQLAQAGKSDAQFCFCAVGLIEDGQKTRTIPAPLHPETKLWGINRICHQGILYHRDTFLRGGKYRPQWKITADYLHLLEAMGNGPRIAVFPGELARFHRGGISDRLWPALKEFGRLHRTNAAGLGLGRRILQLLAWAFFVAYLGAKRSLLFLPGGNRLKEWRNAMR